VQIGVRTKQPASLATAIRFSAAAFVLTTHHNSCLCAWILPYWGVLITVHILSIGAVSIIASVFLMFCDTFYIVLS
jgi:hypothetical protein